MICKNELVNYLVETNIANNKYYLQNLSGNYLNFDNNNLQKGVYYANERIKFNFKRIDDYYLISTDSQPEFYINTNLKGDINLVVDINEKGNRWKLKKLNNEGILKDLIRNDSKSIPDKTINNIKNQLGRLPNNIDENNLRFTLNNKINDSINLNTVQTPLIQKDLSLIYNKYKFIFNNGYYIQSFDYSYYISDNRCMLCPILKDIIVFS
tara:strand:- start:338 stop:967 length:630 start_codon:yes stop_codon:yes gene_type:complete